MILGIYVLVPGTDIFTTHSNSKVTPREVELRSSTAYNASGLYDWSNFTSLTYKIPLEVNSSHIDRTDYSVKIYLNFTQAIDEAGYLGEEFDEDSIRVVEYEGTNSYYPKLYNISEPIQMNRYVIPSLFIPLVHYDNYDATTNAIGYLWFEMPGTSVADENRTFMIYFDTIENTGGGLVTPNSLIWKKDYNRNTDVFGDKMYHLAYGSQRETVAVNEGKLSIWNENLSELVYYARPHSSVPRYLDPVSGDFNGDGNAELLVNDQEDNFWLMDYNPTTGLFYPLQTVNGDPLSFESVCDSQVGPQGWNHYSIFGADIDNDGYDEIIAPQRYPNNDYIIIYNITFDAQLNHLLNVQEYINTTNVEIQAMVLADMDHNGYLDIIGGDVDGDIGDIYGYTVYFWMNDGTGIYNHFNITQAVHTGHGGQLPQDVRSISAGDIDNDGNIELVMTDDDNYHYLYIWQMNETNQMEYEGTYTVPTDPNFYEPVVGAMYDWDYDGYTEIIIGNSDASGNSSIAIIEVKGDETTPDRIVQEFVWGQYGNTSVPYHNLYFPRFGDVNNDGEVEMAVGSYRKWDLVNINEPSVLIWNDAGTTAEWISPPGYNYVGGGDASFQTMLNIFGAWDNYVYRQEPISQTYSGKAKNPDLSISVLDMDYGPVYNAKVMISRTGFSNTAYSDQNGLVNFALLKDDTYTINIYYSTPYYAEELVYTDSVLINSAIELYVEETFVVPLQKVYFDITDINEGDFTAGNLVVWNETKGGVVTDNVSLGTNVEHFTWIARSSYEVSVQYLNDNYKMTTPYVNDTTIFPDGNSTFLDSFDDTGKISLGGDMYQFIFDYEVDSLLNWIDIDISSVTDYIDSIEIQLVFELGEDTVYYENILGTSTTSWSGSIPLWSDSNGILRIESLRSEKVRVIVIGYNTTTNTGTVDVDLYYQAIESISVPLSTVELNFIDGDSLPAVGFAIQVYDTEADRVAGNYTALVNLTTNDLGEALDNDGNPFYYFAKSPVNYSLMAIFYRAARSFIPSGLIYENFTFSAFDSFTYQVSVQVSTTVYTTDMDLLDPDPIITTIDFDQDYYVHIHLTANDSMDIFDIDGLPVFNVYSIKTNTLVFQEDLVSTGTTGYYNYTFNPQSNGIVLGGDDYSYYIVIEASTPGYGAGPIPVIFSLTINPINTTVTAPAIVIETWTNIALFDIIYEDRDSAAISDATITYDAPWLFDSVVVPESGIAGTYTVSINTVDPGNVGDYILKFTAFKDNYRQQEFDVRLSIRPLATRLNSSDPSDFLFSYVTPKVNLTQSYLIYFNYTVADSGAGITSATVMCTVDYILANSTIGSDIVIVNEIGNGIYVLDYGTELLAEGTYDFDIKLEKLNYDAKVASITLEMIENQFSYAFETGSLENNVLKFTVEQGDDTMISIDLKEKIDGSVAENANVVFITWDGQRIDFTYAGNGIYTYTVSGDINTFIQKQILEGTIEITQDYYETYTFTVQVTVKMHSLFAGIPTFYLVLGIAFVVVGAGAIVLTKAVQNARIPEFVKKCDVVAKEISKKKSIDTHTSVVKSKEETLMRLFGKAWEELGLDFKSSLKPSGKSNPSEIEKEEKL